MKLNFNRTLYLVTHRNDMSATDLLKITLEAIEGGVDIVQLREKNASFEEMCTLAMLLKSHLDPLNIPLIINDRVDVAHEIGAQGVHLGQTDLNVDEARMLLGDKAIIGLSIENLEQLRDAQELNIDYIAASPVFATQTKNDCSPAWGLDGLKKVCSYSRHPVIAIGGINESNTEAIMDCGAAGIAVISNIFNAPAPREAALTLKSRMRLYAN